ncbi:hypothetical protein [Mangrovihabitans endophyticus]|uniref:Uncharacterized protein n=1 Tax=Mangrovihabitans endophyticus TaxID=1751298 RepID=A0A8J3BX55_9ACTN|nr:hypothetical protein [Mangrovihabitans endophyticus]GGK74985.1 hypothetical protein GCM10012284_06210 [Mangrovihabitans endophyticus]
MRGEAAIELVRGAGAHTVTTARYRLTVDHAQWSATLADPAGQVWSRLSLLASVDRPGVPDETYGLAEIRIADSPGAPGHGADDDAIEMVLTAASTAWSQRRVRLRCLADRVEVRIEVDGAGDLDEVRLLGGRAILPDGACGTFRSSTGHLSVFDPTPTEPVQVVRPASAAVALGVVGDASPGRLHAVFSPPPLCLAFGRHAATHPTRVPGGDWLAVGLLAAVAESGFTTLRYDPLDGGFLLVLEYDGRTAVDGTWQSPALVLRPVADPWAGLAAYRRDLVTRGLAPEAPAAPGADWWREPIFCGWGAQCAAERPAGIGAPDLSRQDRYDGWLARLAEHDVVPGTVVIDDRWQRAYGTGEPDLDRWPDLRGWIAGRHAAGQRVLLWWRAWDPEGLPTDECMVDPAGRPVAADPGSPAYRSRLTRVVTRLLGPDGLDADGFKIDFTQRAPAGRSLRRPGAPAGAPWGIAALHVLLDTIHRAAKAVKPDAMLVTHTPHPGFGDVADVLRLNDVLDRDPAGQPVAAADQLAFRHAVVSAVLPGHPVDTDQWPIADRAGWRDYVTAQGRLGVPALYYVDRIDGSGEELTTADLALVARCWQRYRERNAAAR